MNPYFWPKKKEVATVEGSRSSRPCICSLTCHLDRGCISPKMPVTGQGRLGILVIAEAPGESEDRRNTQLTGQAGQVLRDALHGFGVDLDKDCRKTNAVRCRPPANRKPTPVEIASCQSHIWDEIKAHPPKLILLLGQSALESFLLNRQAKSVSTIGQWRGMVVPDQKAQCWTCTTYHPSYILRCQNGWIDNDRVGPSTSVEEQAFLNDIEHGLQHLRKPFPVAPVIKPTTWDALRTNVPDMIAIDYETTGLRPWKEKTPRIISVGISYETGSFAMVMIPEVAREWKRVLAVPSIKKIAHNMKFEHQWASHCLGVETQGWIWDTMLAAHMVDNRKHICALKHQAYLNFGVETWGGDFDFKTSPITEATPELLRYNALDAFWTFQLYKKQKTLFK